MLKMLIAKYQVLSDSSFEQLAGEKYEYYQGKIKELESLLVEKSDELR